MSHSGAHPRCGSFCFELFGRNGLTVCTAANAAIAMVHFCVAALQCSVAVVSYSYFRASFAP